MRTVTVERLASTNPAAPIPTAATSWRFLNCVTRSTIVSSTATTSWPIVSRRSCSMTPPAPSTTPASTLVPPMSIPTVSGSQRVARVARERRREDSVTWSYRRARSAAPISPARLPSCRLPDVEDRAVAAAGQLRGERRAHRVEQDVAGLADAAADHHDRGVEDRRQRGDALSEPATEHLELLDGERVPGVRGLGDQRARDLLRVPTGHLEHAGREQRSAARRRAYLAHQGTAAARTARGSPGCRSRRGCRRAPRACGRSPRRRRRPRGRARRPARGRRRRRCRRPP